MYIPGASAKTSSRSRLRTLQNRLNLKNRVRHDSSVMNSQISGPTPRSATSEPLTSSSRSPERMGDGAGRASLEWRLAPSQATILGGMGRASQDFDAAY